MENKEALSEELIEGGDLCITEVDFATGKTLAELKKNINKKIEQGYRPIEQNPFFNQEGEMCLMMVYEEYIDEEE